MRVTPSKFQPRPQTAVRAAGRSVASHTSVLTTCLKSKRRLRESRTQFAIEREREKDSKCVNSSAGDGAKKYGTHYGSDFAEDRDANKQTHKSPNDETLGYLATCAPPRNRFATLIFTSLAPPLLPFAPLNHPSSLPVSVARGEPGFALSLSSLLFSSPGASEEKVFAPLVCPFSLVRGLGCSGRFRESAVRLSYGHLSLGDPRRSQKSVLLGKG